MTGGRLHTRKIIVKMSQNLRNGYLLVSINPHGLIRLKYRPVEQKLFSIEEPGLTNNLTRADSWIPNGIHCVGFDSFSL